MIICLQVPKYNLGKGVKVDLNEIATIVTQSILRCCLDLSEQSEKDRLKLLEQGER